MVLFRIIFITYVLHNDTHSLLPSFPDVFDTPWTSPSLVFELLWTACPFYPRCGHPSVRPTHDILQPSSQHCSDHSIHNICSHDLNTKHFLFLVLLLSTLATTPIDTTDRLLTNISPSETVSNTSHYDHVEIQTREYWFCSSKVSGIQWTYDLLIWTLCRDP